MVAAWRTARRRTGFSLTELLVVIGIIALLLGLLLPMMARARRHAQITLCMSNVQQIVLSMKAYAVSNEGRYPTLDMPATGANLWDVPHSFYDVLIAQGLSHKTFFCPAAQDTTAMEGSFNYYGFFYIIDYNIWVPRKNGVNVIPPAPTGSPFQVVTPTPTAPFAGPAKSSDLIAMVNPMISDIVGSDASVTPPANADVTKKGNPYLLTNVSNHQAGGRMEGVNLGYADGHVEMHPPQEIKPYYCGNWWNWH